MRIVHKANRCLLSPFTWNRWIRNASSAAYFYRNCLQLASARSRVEQAFEYRSTGTSVAVADISRRRAIARKRNPALRQWLPIFLYALEERNEDLWRLDPVSKSARGDKSVAGAQRKCSIATDRGRSVPGDPHRCQFRGARRSGWGSFPHLVLR
jgi:hypothetical protein